MSDKRLNCVFDFDMFYNAISSMRGTYVLSFDETGMSISNEYNVQMLGLPASAIDDYSVMNDISFDADLGLLASSLKSDQKRAQEAGLDIARIHLYITVSEPYLKYELLEML
jgi:hypothetical protein